MELRVPGILLHATKNRQSKIRIVATCVTVTGKVFEQFDLNVQVVFCHEAITAPQNLVEIVPLWLYNSTLALGCFSCLGGFHVRSLSEQHDTPHHPSGEFFWKFLVYVSFMWSHFTLSNDPAVR